MRQRPKLLSDFQQESEAPGLSRVRTCVRWYSPPSSATERVAWCSLRTGMYKWNFVLPDYWRLLIIFNNTDHFSPFSKKFKSTGSKKAWEICLIWYRITKSHFSFLKLCKAFCIWANKSLMSPLIIMQPQIYGLSLIGWNVNYNNNIVRFMTH